MAVCPSGSQYVSNLLRRCCCKVLWCGKPRQQRPRRRRGGRVTEKGLQFWEGCRGDLLELVAASRDLFLERAEVAHHHLQGRSVRISQVHWPDRKLLAHELMQEAHARHQASVH